LSVYSDASRTLGWLVLKSNSLSFYDRNPDYAIARKPLCHIDFSSTDTVCEALSHIHERFGYSQKQLSFAFGIRQYSGSKTPKDIVFIAPTLQSKVDWIEATSNAFSTLFKENKISNDSGKNSKRRSLKSVSIVPIALNHSHETSSLMDISIRSSMLEDSTNSSIV